MHVVSKPKDDSTVLLTVTAGEAELEPIRVHTLSHFRGLKVPGFRKGKAPLNLIEKNIDQQAFMNEFMEHAVNELYSKAIVQEKLRTVAPPQIEVKKFVPFTDFEMTATVMFVKVTKLADYKKIKVPKPDVEVTAKDVEDVIQSLRLRTAERTSVDRPAKNGDELIIDFEGKDEKSKAVAGADGKDYPLMLGSKTFIPGFEEHLVGLKAGQDKEFTITFPKDYGVAALQGRKVTFKVQVKTVNQLYQNSSDEAFVAKVSPFKTLAELKADIKKSLLVERQAQADRNHEGMAVSEIVAKSTLKVPKQLVEEQVLRMEEEEKRNLTFRGQTWEEHLKQEGINLEQHRDRHRPEAEATIKAGILLGEIAEQENIRVTQEEVEIRLQLLKGQHTDPAMLAELEKPEAANEVQTRLLTEKTLAKVSEYAS